MYLYILRNIISPGQVTYRVVQVAPQDGGEPQQVITHNPFQSATPGAHVAQVSCH